VFTCIAIVWFTPIDRANYLAAIKDKHRLLKSTTGPRIIFIGGSNLAFGLDSSIIQKETGYNVVNMGLHAGLGIRYMINEVKADLRDGDIMVLIPEYKYNLNGKNTLLELLLFFPEGFSYLDVPHYKKIIEEFPVTLRRRFEGYLEFLLLGKSVKKYHPIYNRKAFNRYGDITGHLDLPRKKHLSDTLLIHPEPEKWKDGNNTLLFLNRCHADLKKRNIRFFFTFPAVPASFYNPLVDRAKRLHVWLTNRLEVPVLGRPGDFVYPDEWFYDTIYHPLRKAREARSLRLADLINNALVKAKKRALTY
jgi:hypothetical protein